MDERVLEVLPPFASLLATEAAAVLLRGIDGLDVDRLVQVGHHAHVEGALPPTGRGQSVAHVAGVTSTRRGAVVEVEVRTVHEDGALLATNRLELFTPAVHEGEGLRRPADGSDDDDPGPPATQHTLHTLPQQAAMFRLVADRTPLHVDPTFAQDVGFERPPLQGLCTWGMVAATLLTARVPSGHGSTFDHRARFASAVYPGDRLTLAVWQHGPEARWCVQDELGRATLTHGRTRLG